MKDPGELGRLAEEQAALRRVATLVAEGARPSDVFETVCEEVARLVPAEGSALTRFETDGRVTALGGWTSTGGYVHVGRRFALEGTVSGLVYASGKPERIIDYLEEPGLAAEAAREMGWRSSVGAPITVEGRLWGALAVISMGDRPLPHDTEERLAKFTDLLATAIANTDAREELTRLADEQAALRRVATQVAQGPPPSDVFHAVCAEVGRLVPADAAALNRYESDDSLETVGSWSRSAGTLPVGTRTRPESAPLSRLIRETRRPARVDYEEAGVNVGPQVAWR